MEPRFRGPDAIKVSSPNPVRRVSRELAVQHLLGDVAALITFLRQATPPWPGQHRRLLHEPLDAAQSGLLSQRQQVASQPSHTLCAVTPGKPMGNGHGQKFTGDAAWTR